MKKELSVEFEAKLVVKFTLPGVRYASLSGNGGPYQLESDGGEHTEWYRIEVNHANALATADTLRRLAAEISRVALSSQRSWPE